MSILGAGNALAHQPAGVPLTNPGPVQCTTSGSSWRITAVRGTFGEFPVPTACTNSSHIGSGEGCFLYSYTLEKLTTPFTQTADSVVFAASADQDLDAVFPTPFFVQPPGTSEGDLATGFLDFAFHEYPVRVVNIAPVANPNFTPINAPIRLSFVGPSGARLSTVFVRRGNSKEACLIAGPGVLGERFKPSQAVQQVEAAGRKCIANITRDSLDNILDISIDPSSPDPNCQTSNDPGNLDNQGKRKTPLVNGEPLSHNEVITYGTATTTCYVPKNPTPAWCICTKTPCP